MKSLPNLQWVEELLPEDYLRKSMFGGFAYYVDEKLVLLMFEGDGSRTHRGIKYKFEIWNGCMFPAEHDLHPEILQKFPFLIEHPVLAKWLYLPSETEDFENFVESVMREIRRRNPAFGTLPKAKKSKRRAKDDERIDTRKPMMFRDDTKAETFAKARKLSDLRNLGPVMEKAMVKAGIKTVPQFVELGWKESILKLAKVHPRYKHTIYARVLIGALNNVDWNRVSDAEKKESQEFVRSLKAAGGLKSQPGPRKKLATKKSNLQTRKKAEAKRTAKNPAKRKSQPVLKKSAKKYKTRKT